MDKPSSPTVSIVYANAPGIWATSLKTFIEDRGYSVHLTKDGNDIVTQSDCVILAGSVASLRRTREMIRKTRPEDRPVVIAWNFEPLPPIELENWAEKLGLRFCHASYSPVHVKPLLNLVNLPIFSLISRFGLGKYSDKKAYPSANALSVRFAIEQYGFLKQGYEDGYLTHIATSTNQKKTFLSTRNIPSTFIPAGSLPAVYGERIDSIEKDIDVMFIGGVRNNPGRKKRVELLQSRLEEKGLSTDIHFNGLMGDERTRVLNRARVLVHLHKNPWDTPWMRWYLAGNCEALIVSEELSMDGPLKKGEHYLSTDYDTLPDVIYDILQDEEKRHKMVIACKSLVNTEMGLQKSVESLLNLYNGVPDEAR